MVDGIGESTASFPSCLTPGFILHNQISVPNPVSGSGFENSIIDLIEGSGSFTNNSDGTGSFANPSFNTVYYMSPAADISADWAQFNCFTSTASNGQPVVYLQDLNPFFAYDDATCTVTFIADGGLNAFYNTPYDFTITNPIGDIVEIGQVSPGAGYTFLSPTAGIYTVDITDGACSVSFSYDASNCGNPCEPSTNNINLSICSGETAFLEGADQTEAGTYTEVYVTPQGCDSTVITELSILEPSSSNNEYTICTGSSILVGTSSYESEGVYIDTLVNANGCDSIVTSTLFLLPAITASDETTICMGSSFNFNGTVISTEGVYIETLSTAEGCDSTVYLSVFVTEPPIGYDAQTICIGDAIDFGGTLLTESGVYYDTVSAANGCDSIVRLELSAIDCSIDLQVSNIVTPNGDNLNDTWKVNDPPQILGCTVKIFNRWGQLVYETTDYNNTWAGTKDNEELPDGVYYYAISCNDKELTGSINLLRLKK
jgi:gliding motility-associated-like protein